MVDLWHDEEFHNPRLWSDDRLHMAPVGHRRVAAHVLRALDLEPDPAWLESPGPPDAAELAGGPRRATSAGPASTWRPG